MLYFVIYKNKKENDYKMFSNHVFDNEKDADSFGKKSMKRNSKYKVVEYDTENYNKYWYK